MNVELRITADPESRAVYVDGEHWGLVLWHNGKWRLVNASAASIPWAVIEAVTEFKSAHMAATARSKA